MYPILCTVALHLPDFTYLYSTSKDPSGTSLKLELYLSKLISAAYSTVQHIVRVFYEIQSPSDSGRMYDSNFV